MNEETTEGHLLDGRVRYAQPRRGYRSGIEPVLLAATIPARAGERVVEAGSGAGATLLCLAARVAGIEALGIERDAAMAALATSNAAANGCVRLRFIAADLTSLSPAGDYDHACANPPWHAADGTPSPDPRRRMAKQAADNLLERWTMALAAWLRPRGTLTLVVPAAAVPAALAAFIQAGCQPGSLLPLWPHAGEPAKLVLLRARKGGRSPFRVLPGLVLHQEDGGFSPSVQAVLRDGAPLPL